ncbi:hydroxyethylthiazole kinase [Propionivibrio sp.]|uniref:hydroxyethylthiazole kinase n=1 Tax=Propionivibrio sp. TaxID=2212460 RepID=UPI003BF3C946
MENQIWRDIQLIREDAPLVLNITNHVVMNTTANALLAIGASPVMAHAIEEIEEMVALAKALVINIGTLSSPWIMAMFKAGKEARRRNIPIVLDPVGCGATRFRMTTVLQLIREIQPTIIRGNASEIRSLALSGPGGKGVDSQHTPDEVSEDARALSRSAGCVVSVSGPVDLVVQGDDSVRIANGHPLMTKVTGMGCTASAITGAFVAINPSPFQAAAHGMAIMGISGEIAAGHSAGPGSFQSNFLDALYGLQEADIVQHLKMQSL